MFGFRRGGRVLAHEAHEVTLGKHLIVPFWSFRLDGKPLVFLFEGDEYAEALRILSEDVEKGMVMKADLEGDVLSGGFSRMVDGQGRSSVYRGFSCEVDIQSATIKVFESVRKSVTDAPAPLKHEAILPKAPPGPPQKPAAPPSAPGTPPPGPGTPPPGRETPSAGPGAPPPGPS